MADETKVRNDIIDDGIPHLLVGLLHLAVAADIGVDDLIGVQDVLPDIEKRVSVPEGKDDEGGVDSEDALHVFFLLFDEVGVQGAVAGLTDVAFPVQ